VSARLRAAAFDVGNVLLDWLPETLPAPLAAASGLEEGPAMNALFAVSARDERRCDLGTLAPAAFMAELREGLIRAGGRPVPVEDLRRIWCSALRFRPGASPLLARLRRDVDVAVWSNTDPIHFAYYAPWLPCLARARSLHLSFLVGKAKPDRAFFESGVRALGRAPEEVFFVDDLPANVAAARALGIDAAQAATLAEVEAALATRGLLR